MWYQSDWLCEKLTARYVIAAAMHAEPSPSQYKAMVNLKCSMSSIGRCGYITLHLNICKTGSSSPHFIVYTSMFGFLPLSLYTYLYADKTVQDPLLGLLWSYDSKLRESLLHCSYAGGNVLASTTV